MSKLLNTADKLSALRLAMKKVGVQAYIIPSEDAHQSEYIADSDGRRAYISGFNGSAGLAVVTDKFAALWTDGRYFLQASRQLDSNWILQKSLMPGVPSKEEWLKTVLDSNSIVGLDPKLISVSAMRILVKEMTEAGHSLSCIPENLVDAIWQDQPQFPRNPVFPLELKYTGKSASEKIKDLQELLKGKNAWGFVASSLDEIAWLFNLRGSDIPYNPVFFSYALVTQDIAYLYIDQGKLTAAAEKEMTEIAKIKPYNSIFEDLKEFSNDFKSANQKLWIDSRCSVAIQNSAGGTDFTFESRSPIMIAKSIKTSSEIQGFRDSHIRDSVALCKYFSWLENELVVKKNQTISEVDGANRLESFRSELTDFMGLSFDTISSVGANGAIIHYKPELETCSIINMNEMYLCDSGAQFRDGTTDVTRTMHFGNPTSFEIEAFTRVLKGHIQLDMAVFPKGTTGFVLDVLARTALWKGGLDFRHGTGHGVGSFLNVHEGPQGIAPRIACNETALQAGMTITNEPGYYEDGKFGIRIENVMIVKKIETEHIFGEGGYLGFEHVTLAPIQKKLIKASLLTNEEREWLDNYHLEVWNKISPKLKDDVMAYEWLKRETSALNA